MKQQNWYTKQEFYDQETGELIKPDIAKKNYTVKKAFKTTTHDELLHTHCITIQYICSKKNEQLQLF